LLEEQIAIHVWKDKINESIGSTYMSNDLEKDHQ